MNYGSRLESKKKVKRRYGSDRLLPDEKAKLQAACLGAPSCFDPAPDPAPALLPSPGVVVGGGNNKAVGQTSVIS
ncbi:hypothetical protein Y032_0729g1892 [Ancylostoma ceylanicum]|uniref:Uncharacterized protein n=1 Tax=Ancylostoma ceylanicum TaxID=53326 RepID=A0A016WGW7_9BILA|nr:hypothetical protein Y032_0729g1892 [Ancylostoma ceylanicum]